MKIAVFCSSSLGLAPEYYEKGEAFGRLMGSRGHSLVYGGYDSGIMGAVAKGVAAEGGGIIAVIPEVFNRPEFGVPEGARVIYTETMRERKQVMEQEADAIAVLPGGVGTLDELFECYALAALGLLPKPIAVLNDCGCYDALDTLLQQMTDAKLIAPENRARVRFYTDAAEMLRALSGET